MTEQEQQIQHEQSEDSKYIKPMTKALRILSAPMTGEDENLPKSNEAVDDMRKTYLQIFEAHESDKTKSENWWIEQFNKIGRIYIADYLSHTLSLDVNSEEKVSFATKGQYFEYNNEDVILVGRYNGCSIMLPTNDLSTSRLHAMIFIFPRKGEIIVADVGSYSGIKTISRSSNKKLESSVPSKRQFLVFDMDEHVILQLGNVKFAINPKTCVICLDRHREHTFDCGHHVTCSICSNVIRTCPICRAPIVGRKNELKIYTA